MLKWFERLRLIRWRRRRRFMDRRKNCDLRGERRVPARARSENKALGAVRLRRLHPFSPLDCTSLAKLEHNAFGDPGQHIRIEVADRKDLERIIGRCRRFRRRKLALYRRSRHRSMKRGWRLGEFVARRYTAKVQFLIEIISSRLCQLASSQGGQFIIISQE